MNQRKAKTSYKYDFIFSLTLLQIQRNQQRSVYHHYSVPTILQVVTRICFRKKLFYYRF